MCVIIHLEPEASVDPDKLTNAVHNNPHGWGIVVLGDKFQNGIYTERCVPENGETDPEDIIRLLDQYKDYERILHLRWATVGEVSLVNAHPFCAFDDGEGKEAWFMHNGTLVGYGSDKSGYYGYYDYIEGDWSDEDGISDSKDFNVTVLQPYLDRWDGDYQDWHFQNLVDQFWSSASKGILVSNYEKPWFFGGKWEELDSNNCVGLVKISNNTYFNKVIRGPEHERRLAALAAERHKNQKDLAEKKSNAGFLEIVPWDEIPNPTVNFDRLLKCFSDTHFEIAPAEVFPIIRSLTNDEVGQLLIEEFRSIKEGDFDPETSLAFNLIMAYGFYFELFLSDFEEFTGKDVQEVIDAREVA